MNRANFLRAMAVVGFGSMAGCAKEPETPQEATEDAPDTPEGPVPFDEMEWADIAELAGRISQAPDDEAGFAIAREAGIMEGDRIVDSVKRFQLDDGFICEIRVVGVRHDRRADNGAPAGLTLMAANPMAMVPWGQDTVAGGWNASALRAWCQETPTAVLPQELVAAVVEVVKRVNNDGATKSPEDLTDSPERFWVPSAIEVCGPLSWYAREYGERFSYFDEVLNGEGTQYRWFAQDGVTDREDPNGRLALTYKGEPVPWWYRSPVTSTVITDSPCAWCATAAGFPKGLGMISEAQGALLGFCL